MAASGGLILLAAFGLLLSVSMANGAVSSASGALQAGDERIPLKHVFALMEEDPTAGAGKETLTVLLSDQPVPDELRKASNDWLFWAEKQARAGALHGVILRIDPASGAWARGQLLTRQGFVFYSESVSSPEDRTLLFATAGPIGEQVAGKVSMKGTMAGARDADPRWRVEAEFASAVIQRPAVSGELTGAAAENSPQYKAVLAFLDACRKKDADAILNSVGPPSQETFKGMLAGNKAEALNMLADMAAETAKLKLTKVTVRGDSAEIDFGDGRQTMNVARYNGAWKMAQ